MDEIIDDFVSAACEAAAGQGPAPQELWKKKIWEMRSRRSGRYENKKICGL
jgi:hypothetical protein